MYLFNNFNRISFNNKLPYNAKILFKNHYFKGHASSCRINKISPRSSHALHFYKNAKGMYVLKMKR